MSTSSGPGRSQEGPAPPPATLADLISQLQACCQAAQASNLQYSYVIIALLGALVLLVIIFGIKVWRSGS
jgi:hypothetical protein